MTVNLTPPEKMAMERKKVNHIKIGHELHSSARYNNYSTYKESIEDCLNLSREIQHALMPKALPSTQGIEMSSLSLPCIASGGDLYDVIQISEDLLAFYIFDISCQGVSSALISALAKVSFASNIRQITSPQTILERVNDELINNIAGDFFITAFVAFLDLHSNKLTYCNAGHTYPIIFKRNEKKIYSLKTAGVFLGMFEDANFENESIYLFPEDWFFMFTDGVYQLFADDGNFVDVRKNFENTILNETSATPYDCICMLKEKFTVDISSENQIDDITAVVVEVQTQSRRDQIKIDLGFAPNLPVYLQNISYYEDIDAASSHILRDMDQSGYSDESIRKMKLTVTELLANAIGHGNKNEHSKRVVMGHITTASDITVAVIDEGDGFKPDDVPDPTLPENLIKDHGRGLFIVKNFVDEIHFNKKGNRVLIRKYRFSNRNKRKNVPS